jgi:hypothetical protein
MIAKRITAAVLASALLLSPVGAMAQEEGGAADEGVETPFGNVSPVVLGVVAAALTLGIVLAVTGGDNDNATTTATSTAAATSTAP